MYRIKTFSEYSELTPINESVETGITNFKNKFVLVCVSINGDNMYEIRYLREACAKCDIVFVHVNFAKKDNFIKIIDGCCVLCVGDRMYRLDKRNTLIVKRHAHMADANVTKNMAILANNDFLIVNSSESINICGDKVKTMNVLKKCGVPCPKSVVVNSDNIDDFDNVVGSGGFAYPIIAKVNRESQGNGVFMFDNPQSLKGVAQYIISHKGVLPSNSVIVQEMIDSDCDLRIHVLRKESDNVFRNGDKYEVFAAMKRNKLKDDYRSNASLGADYEYYEPTEDEKRLAIEAAKAVKCVWCGVDIMKDKNTGNSYVLEVNCTPSLKGITNVAKNDPALEFVKAMKDAFVGHIKDGDNEKKVLGYKETFYLKGLDMPLIGLLDTGNGSLTSLRADNIKVDKENETVEWTLFGKTFATKYDGDVCYMSSGGDKIKQPTTRVDITHNGVTYKNIRIKLSAVKGNKAKDKRVLNVNRNLLSKMNAIIDSTKKHVGDK